MSDIDPKLLEMADVFHIPKKARLKYIILPARMGGLSRLLNRKRGKGSGGSGAGQRNRGGADR